MERRSAAGLWNQTLPNKPGSDAIFSSKPIADLKTNSGDVASSISTTLNQKIVKLTRLKQHIAFFRCLDVCRSFMRFSKKKGLHIYMVFS
jgi:hypothetical protein